MLSFCGVPGSPASVMFVPGAPPGALPILQVYIYPTIMFTPQRAVVFTPL